MRVLSLSLAAFVLEATACSQRGPSADTDQVYRVIIDSLYFRSTLQPSILVAHSRTMSPRASAFAYRPDTAELRRGLPASLVAGFVRATQAESVITRFRAVAQPQVLLDSMQEAVVFGEAMRAKHDEQLWRDAWVEFARRYPRAGGILAVSKVGFDSTRSRALVQVFWEGGWLAASADLVVLERRWTGWRITRVINLFVV